MPSRYSTVHVKKGNDGDTPMVAWSAVARCLGEKCRIHDICSYDKRGKCQVQYQFLLATMEMVSACNPDLTRDQYYRIGIHLIPLYKILSKLYIDELALDHPTYLTDKGTHQSHPVYKEIRDTIKMLMLVWRDIGLQGSAAGAAMGAKTAMLYVPDTGYRKGAMRE